MSVVLRATDAENAGVNGAEGEERDNGAGGGRTDYVQRNRYCSRR